MGPGHDSRHERLAREFVQDALETLREVELGLVKLQAGTAGPPVVDHLFRLIHSLKGNASFFGGFQAIRRVAHAMEDILDQVRRGGRASVPAEHALLAEGAQLLAPALRAHLDSGGIETPEATAAQEAYSNKVRDHRVQPAEPATEPRPFASPAAAVGAAPPEHAPTIKVEATGLMALGLEIAALHESVVEVARTAPAAAPLQERVVALAQSLTELRTVPLGRLFDRLPAMVGSLAETLTKSVAVQTEGGNLRVDRSALDTLESALVHLLRNALDHGIERQDVRARRGKPAVGRLAVRACPAAGRLHLIIEDDGAGIDPKRMRLEAVVRKLMSEPEAAALSDDDAIALVFRPGFSTAPTTTEISGRGVGMDAVLAGVRRLGGRVRIHSTPRRGTTITLDLPGDPSA